MVSDDIEPTAASFTIRRVLQATNEAAWRAWVDPEQIKRWWGPDGFTGTVAEVDFREGGSTLVGMQGPQGPEMFNTWTYLSITEPSRIEFVSRFADRQGDEISPEVIGLPPEVPREVRHVVTFRPLSETETELAVEEFGWKPGPLLEMSKLGQEQVLDKIVALFAAN